MMSNTNPQKMGLNPGARKGRVNYTFYKTLHATRILISVVGDFQKISGYLQISPSIKLTATKYVQ
jgi:hypothetical protein